MVWPRGLSYATGKKAEVVAALEAEAEIDLEAGNEIQLEAEAE